MMYECLLEKRGGTLLSVFNLVEMNFVRIELLAVYSICGGGW